MKSDANVGVGSPLKGSPALIFGLPLKLWQCSFRLLSLLPAPFCPKPSQQPVLHQKTVVG